jgi:PAS domain S-box-containing protein
MDELTIDREPPPGVAPAPTDDALLRERGLLQILAHSMPDLIYIKDEACRYVFNNASHLAFLGAKSAQEVRGKTVLDLFPGELAEKFYRDERAIIESGHALVNEEEETVDCHGRRFWVSTTKVLIRDEHGTPVGLAGISRDITDRRLAEQALRRAHDELELDRLELMDAMRKLREANDELAAAQLQLAEVTKAQTIGAMAAGIAHEVNNPLAIMGMGLDFLAMRAGASDEGVQSAVRGMRAALEHARGVVQGLLDFSRPGRMDRQCMSVRVPIERALLMMRGEVLRKQAKVRTDLAAALPAVEIDCSKIEQVLINVLHNALQAMPSGGTVTVSAAREADGVRVTVDDSGPGIPEERLARLFEPFFTTKPKGEGTGLGLTVARGIMKLHGGSMTIGNRPEGGVRVTLFFTEGLVAHDEAEEAGDGR